MDCLDNETIALIALAILLLGLLAARLWASHKSAKWFQFIHDQMEQIRTDILDEMRDANLSTGDKERIVYALREIQRTEDDPIERDIYQALINKLSE